MIGALRVYRGAGFVKLPLLLFLFLVVVTLPFVLACALIEHVARWLRGPQIRISPRGLRIGRRRYEPPSSFEVEGLYGGGARLYAELPDGERIELPTGPLSYAEADELATAYAALTAAPIEEGRYR